MTFIHHFLGIFTCLSKIFGFEFTRRYDLIRWGEFVTNMHEMVNVALSAGDEWKQVQTNSVHNYFKNVTEAYNYFPIPDQEMSVNKAITENNPGW
jgi:starch-binding outer membrane protein, SusD/RagB family